MKLSPFPALINALSAVSPVPSMRSLSPALQLCVLSTLAVVVGSNTVFADEDALRQEWEAVYDREILPIVKQLCVRLSSAVKIPTVTSIFLDTLPERRFRRNLIAGRKLESGCV